MGKAALAGRDEIPARLCFQPPDESLCGILAWFSTSTINSVISTSNFENQIKVTLPANSTISLQMFTSIVGTAILVSGGAGASLTIIRLS